MGDLYSIKYPRQLCVFIGVLTICRASFMIAELRLLQLTSPMLLGFMVPFRYVTVDLLSIYSTKDGSLSSLQMFGVAIAIIAAIGYQQTVSIETQQTFDVVSLPECHKT